MSFQHISQFVTEKMAEHRLPGVSLGILLDDQSEILTFGVTNVDHPLPVTADTLFQIGSNTKTMTATIMMMLAERGQLDLDAPIRTVLPDFRVEDEAVSAAATIRQLVTHSTGWVGDHFIETGKGADAAAKYVHSMKGLPQLAPPGFTYSYNNSAFAVAGHLIEKLTGQPYEKAIEAMLFGPLGMNDSFIDMADVMLRRFAVGHLVMPDEPVTVDSPWPLPRAMHAVGAVASSAVDMLTYARFYLNQGSTDSGETLISPEGMRMLWTPQFYFDGSTADDAAAGPAVAHSWFVDQDGGLISYRHGGQTVGQLSSFKIIPARRFAYISMTNGSSGNLFNAELETFLLEELCQIKRPDPQPIASTEKQINETLGRYSRPMVDLEIELRDDQLWMQLIPKQGFPTADDPVRPPTPWFQIEFLPNDTFIAVGGPLNNYQGQIIRKEDQSIGWIRFSNRIHPKI
ncbi:MAG: serine hydrolase domain-containing protein [Ardenticatenaceae bacterium]|nr:serine hydrolase domain-containing protein [Ardenticatenaceae bacterium]